MLLWVVTIFLVLILAFVVIARKGRKLRTVRVLPGEARSAVLVGPDGKEYSVKPDSQFYIGNHPENEVVLANAPRDYSVCIFYHRRRFAFQTLSSSRGIRVNEEEVMAGYLTDGDVLEIAGEKFTFHCS